MKHPVDTSAWGEFVVGELFDMIQGRRLKKADFIEGEIPYVMASSYNNGVITHISNPITTGQDLLTADIFGNVFYQPSFIGFGDDNCGLKLKDYKANKYQYLFLATVFKKFQNEASFTNKLRGSWYVKQSIKLPLKPSADPSNYSQADIDWTYMETVMSRVTTRAKERLTNLPQPTDKKKTPVDTSNWGEFVVGELFDKCDLKRIKPDFNKHSDLSSTPSDEFNLPLINAKVGNNGIMYYGRSSDWESETMTLDIVQNGAASTGLVYAQPQATGVLWDAYQIKLKPSVHQNLTVAHLLFLATTTQASIQNKFSYENKAIWNKVQAETIKLPLKPSADLSNYTQEDIDWDYMGRFMQAIEEKAHERVASLEDRTNEDD